MPQDAKAIGINIGKIGDIHRKKLKREVYYG